MSKKLTPWFLADRHLPRRIGVYQTKIEAGHRNTFQHWNGIFWGVYVADAESALRFKETRSAHQFPKWRGLVVKHG